MKQNSKFIVIYSMVLYGVGDFSMFYAWHLKHVFYMYDCMSLQCAILFIVCFGHVIEVIGEISNSTVIYP